MRASVIGILAGLTVLLTACTNTGNVRNYWKNADVTVTESNFDSAEDHFASFAEKLVKAPLKDIGPAVDELMEKLKSDEVSYYVYSEWIVMAFHSLLSPCRDPGIFNRFIEHFKTDGIMSEGEFSPLAELADKDLLNAVGTLCTIPKLSEEKLWKPGEETLFLILNLDCATCVAALRALSEEPGRHIALCFGNTPVPTLSGWEYYHPDGLDEYFDLDAAPFWFTVDADGKVKTSYTLVPEYHNFATPDNQ